MAIRIKNANSVIEVDTILEFSQVMQALKGLEVQKPQQRVVEKRRKEVGKALPQRDYSAFYKNLGESRHAQTLRILREKPQEGVTDEVLRQRLGFNSNLQLAGVMASLSKRAIKFGFTLPEIIHKEQIAGVNGVRAYRYKLMPEMLNIVPGGLV